MGEPASPQGPAKGHTEIVELGQGQQAYARRVAESKATAPHLYLETEVDMDACVELAAGLGDDREAAGYAIFVRASALALRESPRLNGAYRDGRFELYSRINVGVAVGAQDTTLVPVVHDADAKGLRDVAGEVGELSRRAREGSITRPELSGGTFTITGAGPSTTRGAAVINAGQAAILAAGGLARRPGVRDGELVARWSVALTLSCDARIVQAGEGADFLDRIREALEAPSGL